MKFGRGCVGIIMGHLGTTIAQVFLSDLWCHQHPSFSRCFQRQIYIFDEEVPLYGKTRGKNGIFRQATLGTTFLLIKNKFPCF